MAFEYTPLTAQNSQRQRDQYRPFQTVQAQNAGGSAQNPNLMQVAKAVKGLRSAYAASQAASAGSSAANAGTGVGYGLGQSLQAGELGSSTYAGASGAGSAVSGGTQAGSAAGTAGSSLGSYAGYAGMGMNALGILQGMQTPQGVEGRDKGNIGGAAMSAGSGAVSGLSAGGPLGALIGAGLGLESYQWQHGNRKSLTSIPGLIKSELTGGLAARDIGSWTGLWE